MDRFAAVRRLWERHLEPLRDLVSIHGEMERRLDGLKKTLDDGERMFIAHGAMQLAFTKTIAKLTRMRRAAAEDHHAAVREVAPIYERMRRDSRWLLGASRALAQIRQSGAECLRIDERMAITGWRSRNFLCDDRLLARFAALVDYAPKPAKAIAQAPPPPALPLITRDELARALAQAAPVDDVLAFILERWPEHPLTAKLRAYGLVCRGTFGTVTLNDAFEETRYALEDLSILAWPLTLSEVSR